MTKRVLGDLQMHILMYGHKLPRHQRKFPIRPINLSQFMLIRKNTNVLAEATVSTETGVFYLQMYQRIRHGEESKEPYGRHWI